MATISTYNPKNNEKIKDFTLHTEDNVNDIIENANSSFSQWRKVDFKTKSSLMKNASKVLIENKQRFASHMTDEMGKKYSSSIAEIEKCAWVCNYYADNAKDFLADENISTDASKSYITYQPLGVILAVMPWNYPFWQVFRFAAPALMAGNTCVLKHASNVPQCALDIQWIFEKAGFPKHCFNTLLIKSEQVEKILQNDIIKAATLTGSGPAGSSVAGISGNQIKKTVLELGGSDPYIVLDDANLDNAVDQCVKSRLLNTGQSCIGAKRFIITENIYDSFVQKFIHKMKSTKYGDPNDEDSEIGPMARIDLRDEVHEQVLSSIKNGAVLECGGFIPDKNGAYYPPTVLTNVKKNMPAYEDEIFGPVASIIKVKNEAEAISIANDTKFGLGACVFTEDLDKGERIAKEELQAGCCFVNQFVKSDPRLPFGGIKASGYGRELSHLGIKEFMNIKTVYIK